jgi:O-antigen/teichoic acid export membrane protein
MTNLDWKWIGLGVLIMLGLALAASFILALVLGLEEVTEGEKLALGTGQVVLVAVVNFLTFLIGGFIVGLKSAGRTILEPGISAAIAVVIGLLLSGNFTLGAMIAAGLVPFAAGVLGGWLGERRQEAA